MSVSSNTANIAAIRAIYDNALKTKKAGDLDEAERLCRQAHAAYTPNPNVMCLLGETILKQGRPQEAQSWFQQTLNQFPGYPRAYDGLGRAFLAERKPEKAAEFLQKAAEALPDRSSTHLALGRALAMCGQGPESDAAVKRALALDPDRAIVSNAADLVAEDRLDEAEKIIRQYLSRQPDDPVALRLLAKIALDSNRRLPALRLMKKAVEAGPDFIPAWNDLADIYLKEGDFELALEAIDHSISLEPELPHTYVIRGNILSKAQRHDEALEWYQRALDKSPGHVGALSSTAHVLKTIGRTEEAIEIFRRCMKLHPAFGEPYWSLANLKTFSFTDEEVEVMQQLVGGMEVAEESRVNMFYALGKHFENQHEYDMAFSYYRQGADLRRPHEVYDPVQNQLVHDRIIKVFDKPFIEKREGWGNPDDSPILIVGLPRSGSTLIEQILASHSQVEGTMELTELNSCVREITRARKNRDEYPEATEFLTQSDIEKLGDQYLQGTLPYRSGKAFFIDKMPNNFSHIGLLHLILPNAKVINARRHPLDSCLGSFKQLFYKGQSFTYDFFELGQYYLQYQRIMDHWSEVLPGQVLDVHYENMVNDQEGETRRILDYLGLPFEEQCLRFYETDRAINTASSEQVRLPIYTKGLNFWRHYETHLGELIEQLEPLLKQLPSLDRPLAK